MLHGYDIKIPDEYLDDNDKKIDWTESAFHFVKDFIYGIEGQAYKKAQQNKDMLIGSSILEFYLSQVYNQLLQKTNPLIVTTFINIGNICDEKPIYMLILVSKVIKNVYPKMPRSNLDPENEKSYGQSVLQALFSMKNFIVNDLNDSLKELKEAKKMKKKEIDDMESQMKSSNK